MLGELGQRHRGWQPELDLPGPAGLERVCRGDPLDSGGLAADIPGPLALGQRGGKDLASKPTRLHAA